MKRDGYYTSGEFAKKAHVTLRTIRWYDKQNLLKPSAHTESGARLYTDSDLVRLQQILLFKYLGFSLDEIKEMMISTVSSHYLLENLQIQKKLVEERIEELKSVNNALDETMDTIEKNHEVDWSHMLDLIHMTSAEQSLKTQYQNATNISARIRLHKDYSVNPQGWFPWLFEQLHLKDEMKVLEVGCGNGELWIENLKKLPENIEIVLSDVSEGMLRDVRNVLGKDKRFSFRCFDCEENPYEDETFDCVIANHMLFYCEDLKKALSECRRVLKKKGLFACSTYSKRHMQEITQLVKGFDEKISLSADVLYEKFGLDNGEEKLKPYFSEVNCMHYDDSIEIHEAEPLIAYILSCHGNQNSILLDRYKEFRDYVMEQTKNGFQITKDAGIFVCKR